VPLYLDIPYVVGGKAHPRHLLDIYAPQVESFPVLMFVSGGGWTQGSRKWVAHLETAFLPQGIGLVTVDHRLSPEVKHPAHVQDLAQAFVWIKEHIADYGGDPSQIIIGGHSAGGHLTSLLAMDERYLNALGYGIDSITGLICLSGVLSLGDHFSGNSAIFPADRLERAAAFPLYYIREGLPPTLLIAADRDFVMVVDALESMFQGLGRKGVRVSKAIIPRRHHFNILERIGSPDDRTTQVMLKWIQETIAIGKGV
jgi:acetyl esterase/lipase